MCARHIYANLKKKNPNKADINGLFWKVAKSYTTLQYKKSLHRVMAYDIEIYNSIMMINPNICSLACDDVRNNISEAFNHAIDPARSMLKVEMLETIQRRTMLHMEARRQKNTETQSEVQH